MAYVSIYSPDAHKWNLELAEVSGPLRSPSTPALIHLCLLMQLYLRVASKPRVDHQDEAAARWP